jgi:hypothetical protein
MNSKKAEQLYYILCISLFVTFVIGQTSASSIWSDPIVNNTQVQEDYQKVMNDLKNIEVLPNQTNETILTAEEKELLRIKNNLEIQKLKVGLTPEQNKLLKNITDTENKKLRIDNRDFFLYAVLVLICVGLIAWGWSLSEGNGGGDS